MQDRATVTTTDQYRDDLSIGTIFSDLTHICGSRLY